MNAKKRTPMNYQNGLTISQATTVVKFLFGKKNVIKNIKDYENRKFIIFVSKQAKNEKTENIQKAFENYFTNIVLRWI